MHQFSDCSCQREDLQFLGAAPPLRGTLVALPSLAHVRWCTVALEQTYRRKTSRQSRVSSFIVEPLKRHCSLVGSHHHRNRFFFPHGGSKSSSAFSIGLTTAILNVCLQHTKCHFTTDLSDGFFGGAAFPDLETVFFSSLPKMQRIKTPHVTHRADSCLQPIFSPIPRLSLAPKSLGMRLLPVHFNDEWFWFLSHSLLRQ